MTNEERNFRWAYKLLLALAQRCLLEENVMAEENEWPKGQRWHDLVNTSASAFLHRARDLAGIPQKEFLGYFHEHMDEVEDIYEYVQNMSAESTEKEPLEQFFRKLKGQVKLADGHAEMHQQAFELQHADTMVLYKELASRVTRDEMQKINEKLHGLGQEWDKVDSVYLRLKQDRADLIRISRPFAEAWRDANPASDAACCDVFLLLVRLGEIE